MSAVSSSDSPSLAKHRESVNSAKSNLSPKHKEIIARVGAWSTGDGDGFGYAVTKNVRMTECYTFERPEDGKTHARVVFEVMVTKEMCNAHNMMHGGCAAFLVDVSTSVALIVTGLVTGGSIDLVSQSLSTTYHSGAKLGDTLQIISTTTSAGKRAFSARAEIWDLTTPRLAVTGQHDMMVPTKSEFKL